jgi:manganese transport protein
MGEEATGPLLILSQVILSLQLGFAVIPLIHFVSDKKKMGEFVIPFWQRTLAWITAFIIIALNIKLVYESLESMITTSDSPLLISFIVIPLCLFCLLMLLYVFIVPFISKERNLSKKGFHEDVKPLQIHTNKSFDRIAVTVDFSSGDNKAINRAIQLGNPSTILVLIHVLESTNAVVYGEDAFDYEREEDVQKLKEYQQQLEAKGIHVEIHLGFGSPKQSIPDLVKKNNCDMLVMGTHGHQTIKDILLGTTVESVRHKISVPLVLV